MSKVLPVALLLCKDPTKVAFFRRLFQNTYALIEVEDCSSALEWIKSSSITLLFLDLHSLDSSILDFAPLIRKTLGKKSVPLFLISRTLQKSFLEEALRAGVSDVIHEPLDSEEIEERIAVQLHSSQTSRKVSSLTKKLKAPSSVPKNTEILLHKTIIGGQSLKTILETKKKMHPLSLLVIQIDRFFQIEKELGALATTEMKKGIEKILQSHLRPHDFLLSEGPATYLLLLPKTSQRAGKLIAEDLRIDISSSTIATSVSEILVTVSIGVISFEEEGSDKSFENLEIYLDRIKRSLPKASIQGNTVVTS